MNALTRPRIELRSLGRFVLLALLGSAVIAASARVSLPMWPVPATLQTLAVLLLGALGGARLGVASVALYLAEGAAGLPVFAGGLGPAALAGPTAGYLLGFAPAAWIAGQARGNAPLRNGALLLLAHLAVFLPGVLWLSTFTGWTGALMAGFVAFLPGTLVKTALALAAVTLGRR